MKAKTAKTLKYTILALLLGYAASMAVWANKVASDHVCTGIDIIVEGTPAMDSVIRQGVDRQIHAFPRRIVGTPLRQINTAEIEKFLSRSNNFESVRCIISTRGKLVVNIVPLIPVMRVFYGDNSYYINKAGKHIVSNAEFYSDVPVVTGKFCRTFTPKDILPLVNYIKKDKMLSELVSMVNAENKYNLILVPRIRGHVINFGDTTRLAEKKEALALFYRKVMPYKGWNEYDTISVKFRDQVIATRRDKTKLNHAEEYEEEIDLEEATLPEAPQSEGTAEKPQAAADTTKNV